MKGKIKIMNPVALGWFVVLTIVSIIMGIITGLASDIITGIITMLITFAIFGGIEGAYLFIQDQLLIRKTRRSDEIRNHSKKGKKESEIERS